MASGNEGDPQRALGHQGSHRRRLSSGRVAEEAEEVFRSYAFYRYQQEREERGAEVPLDPEIEQIQQNLESSTSSQVGQRLAIIGDDIYRRYDAEFRTMLESLQPTRDNAYEHFTKIASSTFQIWSKSSVPNPAGASSDTFWSLFQPQNPRVCVAGTSTASPALQPQDHGMVWAGKALSESRALPRPPLNHVPKGHSRVAFKSAQGWCSGSCARAGEPFQRKHFP
ncbi:bcl-2 homologous antagonist/killer isoform 3-T3 [Cyanocitta cristata]